MQTIIALLVFGFIALFFPKLSEAQKVYRIGALSAADQFVNAFEGFKSRMAELGYIEGKNVRYDFYNAKGQSEAINRYAQTVVQDKVDLIVTSSTTDTVPVAKATEGTNIPVVFLSAGNPLKLVKSYASSGNNLTGISTAVLELTAKRLELLKELAPWVKRVAAFNNPQGANYRESTTAVREATKKLGLTHWEVEVSGREEIVKVLPAITRNRVDAITTLSDAIITGAIEIIVDHSIKERLPVIPSLLANVNKGCLASYGPDYFALGQQGAMLVGKILRGFKPADLPIEQPSKLKFVINLKTAKAIGLKIPREVLLRANEVIE